MGAMPSRPARKSPNRRASETASKLAAPSNQKAASLPFISINSPPQSMTQLVPQSHTQAPSSNTAAGMVLGGDNPLVASALQEARTAKGLEDNPVRARAMSVQAMTMATQAHTQAELQAQAGVPKKATTKVKESIRRLLMRKFILKLLLGRTVAGFVYPWLHPKKAAGDLELPTEHLPVNL